MKILWLMGICACLVFAEGRLTCIMQDMEYAMSLIEKGILYSNQVWLDEGLQKFKILNKELRQVDPNTYLDASQRRDTNVVSGIINRQVENTEVLEKFFKNNEIAKGAAVYGRILAGCVSCHNLIRTTPL